MGSAKGDQQYLVVRLLGGNPKEGDIAYDIDSVITSTGILTKEYFLEIQRGNVLGQSATTVLGVDNSIGTTKQIVGLVDDGPLYAYQTSAQSLEILSSDVDDTASGSGVRTILIEGLDNDYNKQSETITLNGTSTVALIKTYIRVNRMVSQTWGSTESNEGRITLRLSGDGDVQSFIEANTNISRISVYTVPKGVTGFLWETNVSTGKGKDIAAVFSARKFGGGFIEIVEVPIYQSSNPASSVIPTTIIEKSDIQILVTSSNPNTTVFVSMALQLIDNESN